ncbi:MAG: 3-deoxy-7-phosphoheptulonate synthase [Nitrospirae bacterium]|nr:3-deoxy-7-phosphoheptulonate synthase [Nitrospirota bacterium]
MIIVLKPEATAKEIKHIKAELKAKQLTPHDLPGMIRTVIAAVGDTAKIDEAWVMAFPGVEKVERIQKPYKLVARETTKEPTLIKVGKEVIGGDKICVMAGPCSVESVQSLLDVAKEIKKTGAKFLRGGAYKPRTSPYAFQGHGEEGLKFLDEVRSATGMPIVTELMDPRDTEVVERYADVIQIGTRNMQNFSLLKEVGKTRKPVLLKRGLAATIKEFLMSAEYIMSEGNHQVIFCERGIRTFETYTRNTLDLSAVPILKKESHLPVIIDPSHAVGRRDLVAPMAMAAVAAGADGLMIEVHMDPEKAWSDGEQTLNPAAFAELMKALKPIAKAVGRTI